jgi:hypothetical protein
MFSRLRQGYGEPSTTRFTRAVAEPSFNVVAQTREEYFSTTWSFWITGRRAATSGFSNS